MNATLPAIKLDLIPHPNAEQTPTNKILDNIEKKLAAGTERSASPLINPLGKEVLAAGMIAEDSKMAVKPDAVLGDARVNDTLVRRSYGDSVMAVQQGRREKAAAETEES